MQWIFELPEMAKNEMDFQAQPGWVVILSIFVCKSSFREISMIKMVILDQSKPISLYLKIK